MSVLLFVNCSDRISQLPDDILVYVLSFLSLKEAARTSVLSSRWINLSKHNPRLVFDAHSLPDRIAKQKGVAVVVKWRKYVKWVNCILRSHRAATLKEFAVFYELNRLARNDITRWLEFAFARNVETLELDLSRNSDYFGYRHEHYVFPEEYFLNGSIDFKSLKVLSLRSVEVTDGAVEFFLRNCPLLEELAVEDSYKISNLEVCGRSLVLKHLELTCSDLKSVKVFAPNLASLSVPGPQGLFLENVPMLVDVTFSLGCRDSVKNILPALSCCIFRLEILSLQLTASPEEIVLSTFPELPKLKKLAIQYRGGHDESLMGLTPLIRASPYLQEFVLNLVRWGHSKSDIGVKNIIKFSHHHLKVFKFCDYYGHANDIELVGYMLESCVVLEKIIFDFYYTLKHHNAKQQLKAQVPHHIELVIL
ncbi:PREDICTED: F-box/LRR-repeat protein At3g58900-like [Erythranthe guttata]|uniref:F-box/LRR-repeat protein At3g58900-like n=1 Tax=Erythranthe guttata TaxID=4155 RepID=UPI00064DC44B|nr:PREDICTED: F-box/LRR-repeat protein At3g58900-like [Erythranthe guttata]|eukprot:XP_012831760.1 PREDICTED: F-box/LRR-repeat protein At3g58900-like [Erythranthe guttata]